MRDLIASRQGSGSSKTGCTLVQVGPRCSTKVQPVLEEPEPCLEAIKSLILQGDSLRAGVVGASRRRSRRPVGPALHVRIQNLPVALYKSERSKAETKSHSPMVGDVY